MGVKWKNKEAFFRKLNSTVPGMQVELTAANSKSASEMVSTAQRLVPVAQVDGGELMASIRMSAGPRPTSFAVEAGGPTTTRKGYDYALAQEFGTKKMTRARPFFWPAYRIMRRKFKGRAARAINQAVKKAGF